VHAAPGAALRQCHCGRFNPQWAVWGLPFRLAFANVHSCVFQGVLQKVCHRWYLDSHSLHEVNERISLTRGIIVCDGS